MFHIAGGYLNILMQLHFGPKDIKCVTMMLFLIAIMSYKLIFFFRVVRSLSVITTMIMTCIFDLKVFIAVFIIVLFFFGMCVNIFGPNPQQEYSQLNVFVRNVVYCMRVSMGENQYGYFDVIQDREAYLFWFVWFAVFLIGCLIFLNFIIAEVCNSYQKVKDNIEALVYKERAALVKEAEDFLPQKWKNDPNWCPKYFVIREAEL